LVYQKIEFLNKLLTKIYHNHLLCQTLHSFVLLIFVVIALEMSLAKKAGKFLKANIEPTRTSKIMESSHLTL